MCFTLCLSALAELGSKLVQGSSVITLFYLKASFISITCWILIIPSESIFCRFSQWIVLNWNTFSKSECNWKRVHLNTYSLKYVAIPSIIVLFVYFLYTKFELWSYFYICRALRFYPATTVFFSFSLHRASSFIESIVLEKFELLKGMLGGTNKGS